MLGSYRLIIWSGTRYLESVDDGHCGAAAVGHVGMDGFAGVAAGQGWPGCDSSVRRDW